MKNSSLLRFFLIGLVISMGLGVASFFMLRTLNESSTGEVHKHMISFTLQIVEGAPSYREAMQHRHFQGGQRSFGSDLWILSGTGEILASNASIPFPLVWSQIKKPLFVHDFTYQYRPWRLISDLTLVKLEAPEEVYLLMGSRRPQSLGGVIWVQTSFVIFIAGLAVLIAFVFITIYLKQKSREARVVLSCLEKGDLRARFEIKRLDEIGRLMLDFNRMASEIERLVYQIEETEKARKQLLEELGHDLRTPLTSLKTSIETLAEHLDEMPKEQQREFLQVSLSELHYFIRLVEDLFFMADLGEPRYKKTTEAIDLGALIAEEVRQRHSQRLTRGGDRSHPPLQWRWENREIAQEATIFGDAHLIRRLIKNAFDNAAKFAQSSVTISLARVENALRISIEDDGVGITEEARAQFGQRRKQRLHLSSDQGISLGLGSVIMKTILELHGGELHVERITGLGQRGTRVQLTLPGQRRPAEA